MIDHKKGERVLLDAVVSRAGRGYVTVNCRSETTSHPHDRLMTFAPDEPFIHPHPGVPVADLVEEIYELWEFVESRGSHGTRRANELRAAREAPQKPEAESRPPTKATLEFRDGTPSQSAAFQILSSLLRDSEVDIKLTRR